MAKQDRFPDANIAASIGLGVASQARATPVPGAYDKYRGLKAIGGAKTIPIGKGDDDPEALVIADVDQPRVTFDEAEMGELAESIRAVGVREPIGVRWDAAKAKWIVIDGGRRLKASRMAGKATIPAILEEQAMGETEILLLQLTGNIQRVDLHPVEAAKSFRKLMDANGWTALDLAGRLHIDHDKVLRTLGMNKLPEDIQESVVAGEISPTTAFEIAKIEGHERQREVAAKVVAEDLSRAETIAVVRKVRAQSSGAKSAKPAAKGRATKAKPLPKELKFRTSSGIKLIAMRAKGFTEAEVIAALEEVAAKLQAEQGGEAEAA